MFRLLLVLAFAHLSHQTPLANPENFATTISKILLQHFTHPYEAVHVACVSSDLEASYQQRDLLDRVLLNLRGRLTVHVYDSNPPATHFFYHLVIFDGYESFLKLYNRIDRYRYESSGYYLVVFTKADVSDQDIRRTLAALWRLQIINENIIVEQNGRSVIYTYLPYQAGHCRMVQLAVLHNLTAPSWDVKETVLYWNRLTDFQGCVINGGTFEVKPYMIYRGLPVDGMVQVSGFEGDLLDVIAKQLNFTVRWKNSPDQWGFARERGNSTGLMKMTQEEEVDFAVGCLSIEPERYQYLKAGMSHYTTKLVFAVPRGRTLRGFEKLFRPFQGIIWMITAACLIVTGLVSVVLSYTNSSVRAFVYGAGVSTPLLNAFLITVGGPIPRVPTRNFARTLFILWLMYCFIMGSIYQGSLYKYLQKPLHKPQLRTLKQIEQSGLNYYMVDIGTRYFEHNRNIKKRTIIIPNEKDSIGRKVAELGEDLTDGVVLTSMDAVAYNNREQGRSRFVNIAWEHVSLFPIVMYYSQRSILRDVFDGEIRKLVPSGLVEVWVKQYGDYQFFVKSKERSEPRKLNIEHLAGGYQMCGCYLVVSFVVFLLELISIRFIPLRIVLHRLID